MALHFCEYENPRLLSCAIHEMCTQEQTNAKQTLKYHTLNANE